MKSKTSLLDRAILLHDFKSYTWISVVYLLLLLLAVPFNLYLRYSDSLKHGDQYLNYLQVFAFDLNSAPLVVIAILVVPVFTGMLLFRYLQNSKAADMVHALPIRRATLFNTHLLAGIILLFVPQLITALISWAMVAGLPLKYLGGQDVLVWLSISLLMNLLFFMTTVLIGMVTGMSAAQAVLTYILLFLPTGLSALFLQNIGNFMYGFAADYFLEKINISPLLRVTEFSIFPIKSSEIVIYLLLIGLFYGLSRYFYRRRHLERAGQVFTFDFLYPLCKYGVTFCVMLLLGSYLNIQTSNLGWTYFAYFLGSLLAYILIEIILQKTLHVFQSQMFKGYAVFALTMVVFLAGLQWDCLGYERRIPALAEIESIYMDSSFSPLTYQARNSIEPLFDEEQHYIPVKPIYSDQSNIQRIHALQQRIIANRGQNPAKLATKQPREFVCLAYTLQNGHHFYRQYTLLKKDYKPQLQPIMESSAYKKYHNEILAVQPENVNLIEIRPMGLSRTANLSDPRQIQEAIKILQQEAHEQSYAEMEDPRSAWATISLRRDNAPDIHLSWSKSYTRFDQWLKKSGFYQQARIIVEQDLAYAIVAPNHKDLNFAGTAGAYPKRPMPEYLSKWEKLPDSDRITDPQQLEDYLQAFTNNPDHDYQILFVLKNGSAFSGYLPQAELS